MSLQVWLPLTKNLRNQGLADVTVTNNGATFNSAGKLGGCYYFNGDKQWLQFGSVLGEYYNNDWSIACWLKPTDSTRSVIISEYNTSGASNVGLELTTSRVVRLYWNGSPDINFTTAGALPLNEWTHLTVTKAGRVVKVYFNGELKQTYTNSSDFSTRTSAARPRIGDDYRGNSANTVSYQGYINDFRMYDHCLSPMEVKQISQGLVLHYSFSDDNLESTTNLVTREDGLSDTCYNGATSKYGYGTNTDIYKTVGTFQNRKSTKIYMGTAGLNAYPYIYFDAFNAAGAVIQTLSFDYYPTFQNTIIPYSYNGAYNFSYTTNKTSGSASNVSQITIPVEVGRWNHITVTAQKTDTTNTSRGIGYIRIGSASHTSATTNYWLFSNVQVEAKNHATGYAGVGGTRNSTIVYDCSGFVNNGTINGALTISNDTPKYSVSTYMPKVALITHPRPVFGGIDQEWSCAIWFKLDNTSQTSQYLNNFNTGNIILASTTPLLYLNSGANDYYMYGKKTINANEWTHIVFVFRNSNALRNVYVNGELSNNYGPNKTSTPSGIQDIITIGSNLAGYISDYRIYATALSASDVQSLYQNSAYIDSNGNVYGAVHSEV